MGRKKKLTPKRLALFQRCFNKEAFDKSVQAVLDAAHKGFQDAEKYKNESSFKYHVEVLNCIKWALEDLDGALEIEYSDYMIASVRSEVDMSYMDEPFKSMFIEVCVAIDYEKEKVWVENLELWNDDNPNPKDSIWPNPICQMDKGTYEIIRWLGE